MFGNDGAMLSSLHIELKGLIHVLRAVLRLRVHVTEHTEGFHKPRLRGLAVPGHGLIPVSADALPEAVAAGQIGLGLSVSVFGGYPEPVHGLVKILLRSPAPEQAETQTLLGVGVPLDRLRLVALGSPVIPGSGLFPVRLHADALGIKFPKFRRSVSLAGPGRFLIPGHGLSQILFVHFPAGVAVGDVLQGCSVSLQGRVAEPFHGLVHVLFYALSPGITPGEAALCVRHTVFGGSAKPFQARFLIPFNARAIEITAGQPVLSLAVALLRRFFIPAGGLSHIPFHAASLGAADSKTALGVRISLICGQREPFDSLTDVLFRA